jgi:hypothetical protein
MASESERLVSVRLIDIGPSIDGEGSRSLTLVSSLIRPAAHKDEEQTTRASEKGFAGGMRLPHA